MTLEEAVASYLSNERVARRDVCAVKSFILLRSLLLKGGGTGPLAQVVNVSRGAGRTPLAQVMRYLAVPFHAVDFSKQTRLTGHSRGVRGIAVLADGRFVSASADSTLKVWRSVDSAAEGWCVDSTLRGHTSYVSCVVALEDGRTVSCSYDLTIRVWRDGGDDWICEATLRGHRKPVDCVAVLADGRRLVSGSRDRDEWALAVWTERGARHGDGSGGWDSVWVVRRARRGWMAGHRQNVRCVVAFADGRFASGSEDHTLKVSS